MSSDFEEVDLTKPSLLKLDVAMVWEPKNEELILRFAGSRRLRMITGPFAADVFKVCWRLLQLSHLAPSA